MRSFALTILACVAFGALSWAAPLDVNADVGVQILDEERAPLVRRDPVFVNANGKANVETGVLRRGVVDGSLLDIEAFVGAEVDVLRRDPSPADVNLAAYGVVTAGGRRDEKKSLVTIIVGVIVEITPLAEKLTYVKSDNCTESIVIPLVSEIIEILKVAVSDVECLVGETLEVVLGTVDGVLDCTGLAKLLGELLCLIFSAVGVVLKVVGVVARVNILAVLCDLATVVSCLIAIVLEVTTGIVGNLVVELCGVIGGILPIILELKVTVLIDILGLHL